MTRAVEESRAEVAASGRRARGRTKRRAECRGPFSSGAGRELAPSWLARRVNGRQVAPARPPPTQRRRPAQQQRKPTPHFRSTNSTHTSVIISLPMIAIVIHALVAANNCSRSWAAAATREPPPTPAAGTSAALRYDDDLIEGRLDTSQLCGTRYPASLRGDYLSETSANLLYIVGGDEVDDGQFWPWSVAIYELDPLNGQRAYICSGSLISDKFILTAAHCIQQSRFDILTPDEISLKIASIRLDDERANFFQVERVFVHPEYTVERKTNDIALLKLRAGQRLPARARPICLPSHVANRIDFTDQQVTIIGWGKTSAAQGDEPSRLIDLTTANASERHRDGGAEQAAAPDGAGQTNDTLLQAEVRVTSTDQCNANYSKLEISWLNIDEHFLCASDPQGKRDACQGDSGGPLMWNNQQANLFSSGAGRSSAAEQNQEKWYQLGLVSFGYGCANRQYPGVYTRIAYYMPWILKIVNERRGNGHGQSAANHHHHHRRQTHRILERRR